MKEFEFPKRWSPSLAVLAVVVLGLQPVAHCAAQFAVLYFPAPDDVEISPQMNGGTVLMGVSVDLPSTCESVGTWGQPSRVGNTVSVDAQFWSSTDLCLPVIIPVSAQYNLGVLPPGDYEFVFRSWGTTVKTRPFSVLAPEPTRLSIRVSQVEHCWDSATNAWYQLQYRSTLTTNQWAPFTPWLRGNGSRLCTNDTVVAGAAQRYYQVVRTNAPPGP